MKTLETDIFHFFIICPDINPQPEWASQNAEFPSFRELYLHLFEYLRFFKQAKAKCWYFPRHFKIAIVEFPVEFKRKRKRKFLVHLPMPTVSFVEKNSNSYYLKRNFLLDLDYGSVFKFSVFLCFEIVTSAFQTQKQKTKPTYSGHLSFSNGVFLKKKYEYLLFQKKNIFRSSIPSCLRIFRFLF